MNIRSRIKRRLSTYYTKRKFLGERLPEEKEQFWKGYLDVYREALGMESLTKDIVISKIIKARRFKNVSFTYYHSQYNAWVEIAGMLGVSTKEIKEALNESDKYYLGY